MTKIKSILLVIAALSTLGLLSACTPAEVQYCRSFGVEGTQEYGKCVTYFNQQTAMFSTDRDECELQADMTYPRSLYDFGHYERVPTFGGFYGPHGYYSGGFQTVRVEPDYQHNREVDALRMRIVEPCMQAKGWNSGSTWQAGRHPVSKTKPRQPQVQPDALPWLGK